MEKNRLAVILLGLPGSGKSTQAHLLSLAYGFSYVSPGDIFRSLPEHIDDQIYKQVTAYMLRGVLIPDSLFIQVMKAPLRKFYDFPTSLVFDGLPRSIAQAEWLNQSLTEQEIAICKAIYLDVSFEEMTKRVAKRLVCMNCHAPNGYYNGQTRCDFCGGELIQRKDDELTTVDGRLLEYQKQTEPLIRLYKAENKLIEIDGEQSIHIVFAKLIKSLQLDLLSE